MVGGYQIIDFRKCIYVEDDDVYYLPSEVQLSPKKPLRIINLKDENVTYDLVEGFELSSVSVTGDVVTYTYNAPIYGKTVAVSFNVPNQNNAGVIIYFNT